MPSGSALRVVDIDHLRDAVQDLVTSKYRTAGVHQVGHAAAVPGAFQHVFGDQGHGLGVIEQDTAGQTAAGDLRGDVDQQLVTLLRREVHGRHPTN